MYVRVQSDGLAPTSFTVKATGGAQGINAYYFLSSTGANITSAVKAGTYATGSLAPRETIVIGLRIYVDNVSAAGTTFVVTTRSVTGTQPDAVRASVTTHQ